MDALIYLELDLFAVVLLLLMVGVRNRGDVQSVEQRLFNLVLISTAVTLFFDGIQWLFDGVPGRGMRIAGVLSTYLYYITNTAVPFLWLVYCDFKIQGSMLGLRRRLRYYLIPVALSIALLAVNACAGIVFGFDARNNYRRGDLFLLYSIVTYLPAFFSTVMTLRHLFAAKTEGERRELKYLLFFMLLPTAAFAAQTMIYGLPLIWIASTLSLFIIYTNVQNKRIYLDELTGLSNRRQLAREFSRRIEGANPLGRIYAVMIDADDFKQINDEFGHATGDRLLIAAAGILDKVCAANGDFLVRMGGDEFLILASRGGDEPFKVIRAIEEAVSEFNAGAAEVGYALSLSCGAAEFGVDGADTLDKLLSAADGAMYLNKAIRRANRNAEAP